MDDPEVLRRRGDLDTWHFWAACSHWPADGTDYDALPREEWTPKRGPLCNECRAKKANAEGPATFAPLSVLL